MGRQGSTVLHALELVQLPDGTVRPIALD